MIWRNCNEDVMYRNLLVCFQDLASQVKPGQLTQIIEKICATPKQKIKSDEIELLQSLCFENKDVKEEAMNRINQNIVLEFYWDYLTDDSSNE